MAAEDGPVRRDDGGDTSAALRLRRRCGRDGWGIPADAAILYRNTFHIIWYNITIWYSNIAILYGTTYSLLKYSYNTVGLRRISFFSEIRSPQSITNFFAQTPPPPPTKKCPPAQPLSACSKKKIARNIGTHYFRCKLWTKDRADKEITPMCGGGSWKFTTGRRFLRFQRRWWP
jgi:hypothetical protein